MAEIYEYGKRGRLHWWLLDNKAGIRTSVEHLRCDIYPEKDKPGYFCFTVDSRSDPILKPEGIISRMHEFADLLSAMDWAEVLFREIFLDPDPEPDDEDHYR